MIDQHQASFLLFTFDWTKQGNWVLICVSSFMKNVMREYLKALE